MCGIVGLHKNNNKVNNQFIINACAKMNKRGPDNSEILSISTMFASVMLDLYFGFNN